MHTNTTVLALTPPLTSQTSYSLFTHSPLFGEQSSEHTCKYKSVHTRVREKRLRLNGVKGEEQGESPLCEHECNKDTINTCTLE
mmetsp:Transcript_11395/g.30191  ORF Transcript_11395/g.30191 Transcript_11395/m.30191 type:complete len:84 (-) Transcript_11395:67-318(-)